MIILVPPIKDTAPIIGAGYRAAAMIQANNRLADKLDDFAQSLNLG